MRSIVVAASLLAVAQAQQIGVEQKEVKPKLTWSRCETEGGCGTVNSSVTIDANWRWIHDSGWRNCYAGNEWDSSVCNSSANCTEKCALDGADYKATYGVTTSKDSLSMQLRTYHQFSYNSNSRLFLMENDKKYQTFTLMNNEFAFDIDLSTIECGINAALYFVEMEADGGLAKYPTNKAGAEYGTGYCDATCPRENRWNGGEANYDGWNPSTTDPTGGTGNKGACCNEFDVWNSNAYAYQMSSKICKYEGYKVCTGDDCNPDKYGYDSIHSRNCDMYGCDYNPYRLGVRDFYGKGKTVDTTKKFTVVTQWTEDKVTQFFVQNGTKIESPVPAYDQLPKDNGLTDQFCKKERALFEERDRFVEVGGWNYHKRNLNRPMVLTFAIQTDHWAGNLWLDSTYPPERPEDSPGAARGSCPYEDHEPWVVETMYPYAKVAWSNIRYGPIGSTVKV